VSASDNSFGTAGLSVNCIPAIIRITDVTSERNFPWWTARDYHRAISSADSQKL